MAYDGFFAELSTRASTNEILGQVEALRDQAEASAVRSEAAATSSEDFSEASQASADASQGYSESANLASTSATSSAASAAASSASAVDSAVRAEAAADEAQALVDTIPEVGYFIQDYPNAKLRSYREKVGEEVSVTDFIGAFGDGTTDDSAAIISAVNTGKTVNFPDGSWKFVVDTGSKALSAQALLSRAVLRGTLSIEYGSGVFTHTLPTLVKVVGGERLKIRGTAFVPTSVTSMVGVSGSAGNYSVVLGVSSVAGVTAGNWIQIVTTNGTGDHYAHRGVWEITDVDAVNTRITVRNTHWGAAFPTNTITSSTSAYLKTVLKYDNVDAFVVPDSTIGDLSSLVIVGNSDTYWSRLNVVGTEKGTHGLLIGSQSIAVNGKPDNVNPIGISGGHISSSLYLGVSGFDQQGIVTENGGTYWGDFSASSNNKRRGYYASTGSAIRAKHISACGNFLDGVIADLAGAVYASSNSCASGNGGAGVSATQSGMISFDSGFITGNLGIGGSGVAGGMLQIVGAVVFGNGGAGVSSTYGSTVYCDSSNISFNGSYGIDAGFLGSVRGPSCTITNNSQQGIRATELAFVNYTGSTLSGNTGGDFTTRASGMLLNGASYRVGIAYNQEYRAISQTTGAGVRITTTSGGDDLGISHDTTGSGTYTTNFHFRSSTGGMYPEPDNTVQLGRPSNRWSVVYAGTGTINTSDKDAKMDIEDISDLVLDAWGEVGYVQYRFKDAVRSKGADARLHVGVIAQKVKEAFESRGIDPFLYGILCYDEWEAREESLAEDGTVIEGYIPAGGLYGVRYEEALCLEAAYMRRELNRLKNTGV